MPAVSSKPIRDRPRPWWFRRWFRLGRRSPDPAQGRIRRLGRPEPHAVAERRCRRDPEAIAALDGPVLLVGHSYGGAVVTEAGTASEGGRAGLHRRLRPRRRRVGLLADQGFRRRARRFLRSFRRGTGSCSSTARSSTPPSRPTWTPTGGLHGQLAGPVGRRGAAGKHHHPGVADEAELVPGRHGRPDDPAPGPARDVEASRRVVAEQSGSHAVYVSQPGPVAAFIARAAAETAARTR